MRFFIQSVKIFFNESVMSFVIQSVMSFMIFFDLKRHEFFKLHTMVLDKCVGCLLLLYL